MVTIQPLGLHLHIKMKASGHSSDEELRSIGVRASIRHRKDSGASVLQLEVLIGELLSIDGFTSGSVSSSEVTTLDHEVGNNPMEDRSLVVQRLSALSDSLFSSAQSTEVLHGFRHRLAKAKVQIHPHSQTGPLQFFRPFDHQFQYRNKPY